MDRGHPGKGSAICIARDLSLKKDAEEVRVLPQLHDLMGKSNYAAQMP